MNNFDDVERFNELFETFFDQDKFIKLKEYAKINYISIEDALNYSQSCHYCEIQIENYGNKYCSKDCEINIETHEKKCYTIKNGEDCKICNINLPFTYLFNIKYKTDFNENQIYHIKNNAKNKNITIIESIEDFNIDNANLLTTEDATKI